MIALLALVLALPAADLDALYQRRQLFDLREAVAADASAPPFYRAAVACAFHTECPKAVQTALDTRPAPEIASKLYEMLFDYHFSYGRWAEAGAAIEGQVAVGEKDEDGMREMCRVMAGHGPVTVERRAPSSIRVLYRNAHVPFRVNGKPYRGYVDTGANISIITESAAKSLGLAVESAHFRFGGAAGKQMDLAQIAFADRFVIGNLELRNVPFVVVSDRRQPFVGWGAGKRCVLGLQVLFAAKTMTWRRSFPGAKLELAHPVSPAAASNLCFDGKTPLAGVEYQGRRLTMGIDTGMGKSILRAHAAERFPALAAGPRKTLYFQGIDGDTSVQSATAPGVLLRMGGRDLAFRSMAVYLKGQDADAYDGQFGNDLAGKGAALTFDFERMQIRID